MTTQRPLLLLVRDVLQLYIKWQGYETRSVTGLTTRAFASEKFPPTRISLPTTYLSPAAILGIQASYYHVRLNTVHVYRRIIIIGLTILGSVARR